MEIFMRDISFSSNRHQVTSELASILHSPNYARYSSLPLNFHVHLFKDRRGSRNHGGSGALTLPNVEVGTQFLREYGDSALFADSLFTSPARKYIAIGGRRIKFSQSKRQPRPDVLETVIQLPYINPRAMEEKEQRTKYLDAQKISVRVLQFGWECRDSVFSIESEEYCDPGACFLFFDEERRELRIKLFRDQNTYVVALRYSQILFISVHDYLSEQQPVIILSLDYPPTYECESSTTSQVLRRRLSFLPISDHDRIAPYCSLAIRLVCSSMEELSKFKDLSRVANIHNYIGDDLYPVDRRGLFSFDAIQELHNWQRRLSWCLSFQIESLVRSMVVDSREMLSLVPQVMQVVRSKGERYAASMLQHFAARARLFLWNSSEESEEQTILDCFLAAENDFREQRRLLATKPATPNLFDSLHITITPTTMFLEGPFLERSNRVIRAYDKPHHESFLRVSFADEGRLQYRFDREVDGAEFIRQRVGPILLEGLAIAGRQFMFLAYSQSALKEHAVWFVKEFHDNQHGIVNRQTIIDSLGSFDNLRFDSQLIYCPARYAARLSQAFTATDASVSVEAEEIFEGDDISTPSEKYHFTDGVGTISNELAQEIWAKLKATQRRARSSKTYPRAFQVRFMGSKGMLSVDYKLKGRAICLRPSMIKFEAPDSREIEIARAFDRPGAYFLNRPLIMLLEGLGVPYETFKEYQDKMIRETQRSTESIAQAARMLETYGLGSSYRLTSVMLNLDKLGIDSLPGDDFYQTMVEYSVSHVLRELKNHARIPVPNAWTLVGVADVHKYLKEGQIFACVKPSADASVKYLEGQILISRSPTIHPGDVQIAHAIGRPPPGSCFAEEPLLNTVVFSVLGSRPLPSMLGGGDLDGDVYNLLPLEQLPTFKPTDIRAPAEYNSAPRKLLERPSTMEDVAEFVMEYIISDVVGIIAINWLIIADQSREGIFDPDCLKLSALHSDAVDYPKSGQPVALNSIPKLKFKTKPDWNAPETVNADSANYYESQHAIGRLFRAVDVPIDHRHKHSKRKHRHQTSQRRRAETVDELANVLAQLELDGSNDEPIHDAVASRVGEFIDMDTALAMEGTDIEFIAQIFGRYSGELQGICASCALSHARANLTEEEAIIGTIMQKTSQPRRRKDMMAKLREQTDLLVRGVREELAGDEDTLFGDSLQRSWMAWKLAVVKGQGKVFGARSFGWIALGAIFEAIKEIEEAQKVTSRPRFR